MEKDKEEKFERWILERLNLNKGEKNQNKHHKMQA